MGYVTGPYQRHASLPVLDRPEVGSARKVDVTFKNYEIDEDTGGYVSMPSTAQRVVLTVAFAIKESKFNWANDHEETRQNIVTALAPMVADGTIKLIGVVVQRSVAGGQERLVTYRDLKDSKNRDQTVQV